MNSSIILIYVSLNQDNKKLILQKHLYKIGHFLRSFCRGGRICEAKRNPLIIKGNRRPLELSPPISSGVVMVFML